MDGIKTIYEIRYPKMLNFNEIYKDIINPYFVYPNAKYSISNEGHHSESIRMTFPDSRYHLIFAYDRISFQYDGGFGDLREDGSHVEICFDIARKLRAISTFSRISSELLEVIVVKKSDKGHSEVLEKFISKYSLGSIFEVNSDAAIVIEGKEKKWNFRVQVGPFYFEKDKAELNLFSLDAEKALLFKDVNGLVIKNDVSILTDKVSKASLLKMIAESEKIINKIKIENDEQKSNS